MQRVQLLSVRFARLNLCSSFATVNAAKQPKRLPHGFNKPTAYSLFIKDNYVQGKKVTEEARRLAGLWKSLDASNKKNYVVQAEKIANDRLAAFNRLSEVEQRIKLAQSSELRKKRKENRRLDALREFRAKTAHPKRPGNSLVLFLKDHMQKKTLASRAQATEAMKSGAEAWKNLSASEKKPYIDQAREASEKYAVSLKKWKKEHGDAYKELLNSFALKKVVAKKTGRRTRVQRRTVKVAKARSGSRKTSAKKM
ncbi:hypothetical protein FO519_001148 [Halicephalobus sp. NKZ332]|nr:hypothetical protein FO519_001148 [Halicephalobus sp. NKZ332]